VRLRVLFAADPADEAEVRRRIEEALSRGSLAGADGVTTHWRFGDAAPSAVRDDEAGHAARLMEA
jgi:hypothetical protein